jgi:hypothetical protein
VFLENAPSGNDALCIIPRYSGPRPALKSCR